MTNYNHIDEAKLELYILNSLTVAAERTDIEAHLAQCKGCMELHDEIASYYKELTEEFAASENLPVVKQEEFPAKRKSILQKEYWEYITQQQTNLPFPFRVARWVSRHPYVAGGATLMFSGIIIGALITLFQPAEVKPKDINPTYADFAGEMMIVKNKYGETIDEITIGAEEVKRLNAGKQNLSSLRTVSFFDVDSDGNQEIIWSIGNQNNEISPNLVFCKSIAKNKILWIDTLKYKLVYPSRPEIKETAFERGIIFSGDYDNDRKAEVYVTSTHQGYFATIIKKLDGMTGDLLDIYVHPGTIQFAEWIDFDDDGIKEIVMAGINNSYREACIAILDPRFISGQAPSTTIYKASGFEAGLERAYIKIPKTILAKSFKGQVYWNSPIAINILPQEKKFKVNIQDLEIGDSNYKASYHLLFDKGFHPKLDNTGDDFDLLANKLFQNHIIPFVPDSVYWNQFLNNIQYWDGTTWQNHPVQNKYYLEAINKLKKDF